MVLLSQAISKWAQPQPKKHRRGLTEGDRQLLARTRRFGESQIRVSADDAVAAARRVFRMEMLAGLPYREIIKMFGEPGAISDLAVAAPRLLRDTLVYRFDTGYGGCQFRVCFGGGAVTAVIEEGLV